MRIESMVSGWERRAMAAHKRYTGSGREVAGSWSSVLEGGCGRGWIGFGLRANFWLGWRDKHF